MPESQPEGEAAAGRETATAEAAVAGEEGRVEEGSIETAADSEKEFHNDFRKEFKNEELLSQERN